MQGSKAVDGHTRGAGDEGEEKGLVLGVEGFQDLREGGREGGGEKELEVRVRRVTRVNAWWESGREDGMG